MHGLELQGQMRKLRRDLLDLRNEQGVRKNADFGEQYRNAPFCFYSSDALTVLKIILRFDVGDTVATLRWL